MDWSVSIRLTSQDIVFCRVAAVHVTYQNASGARLLQCLLLLFFLYSFSILSIGMIWVLLFQPANVKMYCLSKVIFSSSRHSYFTHSLATRFKLYYVCYHDFLFNAANFEFVCLCKIKIVIFTWYFLCMCVRVCVCVCVRACVVHASVLRGHLVNTTTLW